MPTSVKASPMTASPPRPKYPPKPSHLKLNRAIYIKYRELLGTYNDKVNKMAQSLPTKNYLFPMAMKYTINANQKQKPS